MIVAHYATVPLAALVVGAEKEDAILCHNLLDPDRILNRPTGRFYHFPARWLATISYRRFQSQVVNHLIPPLVLAEGTAAVHASPQRDQFTGVCRATQRLTT